MFIEASLAGDITQLVPNCYQPSWMFQVQTGQPGKAKLDSIQGFDVPTLWKKDAIISIEDVDPPGFHL